MTRDPTASRGCRTPLRADAERNRERLLRAARSVFAEQGLEAPMTEIARRAGVGVATLFRRFPQRVDLITAVFDTHLDDYQAVADHALADPDAWRGFVGFVEQVCALQAADHGFSDVLTMSFPSNAGFEAKRARAFRIFVKIVARAKASGRLRADFAPQDLVLVLMANAGVVAATGALLPQAWRRPVGYLLQAFDARNTEPLPAPPSHADLGRVMDARTRESAQQCDQ